MTQIRPSLRKRQAAKKNLKKANAGRKIALEIAQIDKKISNNQMLWAKAEERNESPLVIAALQAELDGLLDKREKLELM